MSFDKVVVSHEEVERMELVADAPAATASLPSPIPLAARLTLPILVLFLPLLCLVTLILRVAFRGQTVRVRYAWVSFLATLLLVSSLLTTVAVVLAFSFAPAPAFATKGLGEFDDRSAFPTLPSAAALTSGDVSAQLKPLVVVLSPAVRLWNRQEVASPSFGAGVLIEANNALIVGTLPLSLTFLAASYGRALQRKAFRWPAVRSPIIVVSLALAGVFTISRNLS